MDYIYVDNSNLYIEGRRASAVAQGLADNIIHAMNDGILDHAYTISFGKLHEFLVGSDKRQIKRAALFGSRPPPNDGIWQYAKKAGFELHLEDRNYANKEKKIDISVSCMKPTFNLAKKRCRIDRLSLSNFKTTRTGIATLLTKDAYKSDGYKKGNPEEETFVLVAGDSDYVPTINELRADGFNIEVVFWNHASRELKQAAVKFTGLDGFLETLRL